MLLEVRPIEDCHPSSAGAGISASNTILIPYLEHVMQLNTLWHQTTDRGVKSRVRSAWSLRMGEYLEALPGGCNGTGQPRFCLIRHTQAWPVRKGHARPSIGLTISVHSCKASFCSLAIKHPCLVFRLMSWSSRPTIGLAGNWDGNQLSDLQSVIWIWASVAGVIAIMAQY